MFDPVAYINEPRWRHSSLGLDRIILLLEKLGRPQDRFLAVHVAGTNGKGSTSAYLSSILRASNLRTGLFTSPYIERFEERIQSGRRGHPGRRAAGCDARREGSRRRGGARGRGASHRVRADVRGRLRAFREAQLRHRGGGVPAGRTPRRHQCGVAGLQR